MNLGSVSLPLAEAPALPRALLAALLLAAALALSLGLARALKPLVDQPLRGLRVDGQLKHLSAAQVAAAASIAPGTGLFEVDLAAARRRVETLPWVAHARVSREWPAGLAILVSERQAVARWGTAALVDADGAVFVPPALPAGLPQLSGPAERAAEVAQVYRQLDAALHDTAFAPNGLDLSARGEWTLHTAGGIELRLGAQYPLARLDLIRGAVARTLARQLQQVAYIDLRYSNGFAVGPAPAVASATTPLRAGHGQGRTQIAVNATRPGGAAQDHSHE